MGNVCLTIAQDLISFVGFEGYSELKNRLFYWYELKLDQMFNENSYCSSFMYVKNK